LPANTEPQPTALRKSEMVCDDCYHEIDDFSVPCDCLCHAAYLKEAHGKAPDAFEPD
jgi:hypothetical protein